jgi:signal recognition particle receptor subunit beta
VPGQPLHEATRRVVLRGVDGVAFVADSQRSQIAMNNASYEDLQHNLEAVAVDASKVPIVIQYNKRDLDEIISDDELEQLERDTPEPVFRACALTGAGVFDTFFGLLEATWDALDASVGLEKGFGLTREEFARAVRTHVGSPSETE